MIVCGVDEAGRGPWAGPVVAAAVILPPGGAPAGAGDSKALVPAERARLEPLIKASCFWGLGEASVEEIDTLNILRATHLAMQRAVAALRETPDLALVDGNRAPALPCGVRTIIGGDASEPAIACASILAKEHRDRLMIAACAAFPGYGFARHKGYGVAAHAAALSALGPCPLHRMSFKPVAAVAARFAEVSYTQA
jgi:ribonuclease HII